MCKLGFFERKYHILLRNNNSLRCFFLQLNFALFDRTKTSFCIKYTENKMWFFYRLSRRQLVSRYITTTTTAATKNKLYSPNRFKSIRNTSMQMFHRLMWQDCNQVLLTTFVNFFLSFFFVSPIFFFIE